MVLTCCLWCLCQGLFYRVVWGDVSPFRLVRLSAEELLSREISEWRKPDSEVSVFVGTSKNEALTFLPLKLDKYIAQSHY